MIGFFTKGGARAYLFLATVLSLLALYFLQPAIAHAGPVQWPQTGQQTCWDAGGSSIDCSGTGQDGELKKGEVWPSPRFTSNDQTITDNLTGLVWTKDANVMKTRNPEFDVEGAGDGSVTWQRALAYVAKLNLENYQGYNDWRLPNVRELRSLVNYGQSNPSSWLMSEGQGFTNVQAYYYWSSSSVTDRIFAWIIDMFTGEQKSVNKSSEVGYEVGYVWPVRVGW